MRVLSGTCISKRLSCEKVGWVQREIVRSVPSKTARVKSCNEIVMDVIDAMDMMNIAVATAVVLNEYWNE